MEVVAGDVRNYLHRVWDDDFTVNLNSNDEDAEPESTDRSIRAAWKVALPLRLEFRREEFEVAIIRAQLKNVQANNPSNYRTVKIRDNSTTGPIDILNQRIENRADLFQNMLMMKGFSAGQMGLWFVSLNDTRRSYVYWNLKSFLDLQYEFAIDNSYTLDYIWKKIGNIGRSRVINEQGYRGKRPSAEYNLQHLAQDGFNDLESMNFTVTWGGGPYLLMDDNGWRNGMVMTEDTAYFLQMSTMSEFTTNYYRFINWNVNQKMESTTNLVPVRSDRYLTKRRQ